jgi:hypothetical protein
MTPVDLVLWWTGAMAWTAVFVVVAALIAAIIGQAIYATCVVGRQLFKHHIIRGKTRAEWHSTPGEVWLNRFWEWGLMR